MTSSRADKGKAPVGAKRTTIPEEFLKARPSKRTRASVERSNSHHPEEVVAEDVRPLKVKPPRFRKVSPDLGGGEHGDPPPPMHTPRRTSTGQASSGGPVFPDNSVDFMCSYTRNFMKFSDGGAAIGNWRNQEMRLLQLNKGSQKMESELVIKKDMCSSLERKLEEAKSEITTLRAQLAGSEISC
ncbi:hypothetical protein ACOSQ3_026587 [Xanthoceras sorbifolium]